MQNDEMKDPRIDASQSLFRENSIQEASAGKKQLSISPFRDSQSQEERVIFHPATNMWVVTRYEDAMAVLKNHQCFSSALCYDMETAFAFLEITSEAREIIDSVIPFTTLQMASADQPDHTRLRNSIHEAFRPQRISILEAHIQDICERLIDQFIKDRQAELIKQFTYPLPLLSILSLIGIPEQDVEQIKLWCADWTNLMFRKVSSDQQIMFARSLQALHRYFVDLIALRREHPQQDLTSDLIQAIDTGEATLSLSETVNMLCHLIGAGYETTVNQLNTCLYHLLQTRYHTLNIHDDASQIPDVVEEILRFDPALHGPLRVTAEAVTIDGKIIPKGARVHLLLASANRDPAIFRNPEIFDPMRKDARKHLTFGYGIHHCLGAPLARLELRIALATLIRRLPGLRIASHQKLTFKQSTMVRSLTQLPVEWDAN